MLMLMLGVALAGPAWEPSEWPPTDRGVRAEAAAPAPRRGAVEALYRWYRARSRDDGAVCPYYPTCSAYGVLAWREWGLPVAILLTTDRLLREYPGMARRDDYPVLTPHRTNRFHDPVPARDRAGR